MSFTIEDLRQAIRVLLKDEGFLDKSHKEARYMIEESLKLEKDALKPFRKQINDVLLELLSPEELEEEKVKTEVKTEVKAAVNTEVKAKIKVEPCVRGVDQDNRRVKEQQKDKVGEAPSQSLFGSESDDQSSLPNTQQTLEDDEYSGDEASDSAADEKDEADSRPSTPADKSSQSSLPKNLKRMQSGIMTRDMFLKKSHPLSSKIGELKFQMISRSFKSGSCGWYWGGKAQLPVGDSSLWCQISVNCTVLGSKDWSDHKKRRVS